MRDLTLKADSGAPLHLLCLGAHADDIEIGCGGTILNWIERGFLKGPDDGVLTSTGADYQYSLHGLTADAATRSERISRPRRFTQDLP